MTPERLKEIEEAAKQEKEITIYHMSAAEDMQAIGGAFNKKYPFVKVNLLRVNAGDIVGKILTEQQAGGSPADMIEGDFKVIEEIGANTKMLPFSTSFESAYPEQVRDPSHSMVPISYYVVVLGYNGKLLAREDVPKSWEALLEPRWKGQIGMHQEFMYIYPSLVRDWGKPKADKFFQTLGEQQLNVRNSGNRLIEEVIAGSFPLTFNYTHVMEKFAADGAPVAWVPLSRSGLA